MRYLTIILLCFLSFSTFAQVGEIQGKIKDMELGGEGLPFANVYVFVDGKPTGTSSDMDGFYSIKPLPPGIYTLTVEYVGYETVNIDSVQVEAKKSTFVDVEMRVDSVLIGCPFAGSCIDLPLTPLNAPSGLTIDEREIKKLPTRDIKTMVQLSAGVF